MALRFEVGDLSLTRDQRERAGKLAGVDVALEMIVDASEARRRESNFLGLHEHVNLLRIPIAPTSDTRRGRCR
jgi:hypothetical protein